MKKTSPKTQAASLFDADSNIIETPLVDHVENNMARYTKAVVLDRAIPDGRDGLKPVQRRILYETHNSKLGYNQPHMKLATLSGKVLAYHPHNSQSIDDAAVNLSQPWAQRLPLIDIYGNNGSINGDKSAASRYIEARQTPYAQLLTGDLTPDVVPYVDNYDNTKQEPAIMPAAIPWVLINGAKGIAIGLATSLLPHCPNEMLALMRLVVQDRLTPARLAKAYHGPDFPGGGVIVSDNPAGDLTDTDYSVTVMARHEQDRKGNAIHVVELPPDTTTSQAIESIINAELAYVTSVDNLTEDNKPNIRIAIRKGVNLDDAWADLCKKTVLMVKISQNPRIVLDGSCKTYTVLETIQHFVGYRKNVLRRMFEAELARLEGRLNIVLAEIEFTKNTSRVTKAIQEGSISGAVPGLNQVQEEHILGLTMRRIQRLLHDRDEAERLTAEQRQLDVDIARVHFDLGDGFTAAALADIDRSEKILGEAGVRRSSFGVMPVGGEIRVGSAASTGPVSVWCDGLHVSSKRFDGAVEHTFDSGVDGLFFVFSNGQYSYRRVGDLAGLDVQFNRVLRRVDSGVGLVGVVPDRAGAGVLTVSVGGRVKLLGVDLLRPSVTTRRYLGVSYGLSTCRGGDWLVGALPIVGLDVVSKGETGVQYSIAGDDIILCASWDKGSKHGETEYNIATLTDNVYHTGSVGVKLKPLTPSQKIRTVTIKDQQC